MTGVCPECGKPAAVKFCSRRCAGLAGSRANRRVTPDLQHQVLTRLGTRNSAQKIAAVTGLSASTVRRITRERRAEKFERDELMTTGDVAMMLSVKQRRVLHAATSLGVGRQVVGRSWGFTLHEVALLHTVLRPDEQGMVCLVKAARKAGLSPDAARMRVRRAGIRGVRAGRLGMLYLNPDDASRIL